MDFHEHENILDVGWKPADAEFRIWDKKIKSKYIQNCYKNIFLTLLYQETFSEMMG